MSRYPILVERFKDEESMVIVCERCGAEAKLDPDDLYNEGLYACPAECGCTSTAVYKYDEGDACPGCGKLGFYRGWGGHCSRACQLQVEYAEQLRRERA